MSSIYDSNKICEKNDTDMVDVGVVEIVETKEGRRQKKQCEIDFVVNIGTKNIIFNLRCERRIRINLRQRSDRLRIPKTFSKRSL